MGAAGWERVSRKARLAGKGWFLCKRRNAVDDPFPTRPKGAPQMRPCGVAALDNGSTIACGRRLAPQGHFLRGAWTHLGALHSSISPCWITNFVDEYIDTSVGAMCVGSELASGF